MEQYTVTGMSCAACSARVEKAVSKVPGVSSCSVSLLTNSMGVEGTAAAAEVIAAVEEAGYGASLKGASSGTAQAASANMAQAEEALKEIVVSDCKSRFLIRCGKIIINNPADGVNKGYLLSPETGLLRTDEEKVVIEVETDLDTKKTTEEKDEEAQTKKRNSLLNYHLGPADIIRIQSSDLNGQFIIVRGTHKGSQSGDWKTEIEVRPT